MKNESIQVELTTPYTPEQNGHAERKSRYLVEMTRSMVIDSGLPNKYLSEGVMTANHLQNRLPTIVSESNSYEKWNVRKHNLNYIQRFGCTAYGCTAYGCTAYGCTAYGCTAYAAIPAETRKQKLNNKAKQLRLVDYENGTKGYRLLDTMTDSIYISKDVIFIEGDSHSKQMTEGVNETDSYHKLDNIPIEGSSDVEIDLQINEPGAICQHQYRN